MSVEALAVVLHHSRAKGTDKLVLLGIANHAGDGGAWPTVATLARYANVADRSVQRSITSLVNLGELVVRPQAGGGARTRPGYEPNVYDIIVACPATCDRTMNHRHVPLPATQAELWITGVTPASPLEGGVTPTSPGGVTPTSPLQEPSLEPTTNHLGSDVTVPRASSVSMPRCSTCSLTFEECTRRAAVSGHDYQPARRTVAQVLAPILDNYDTVHLEATP